MTATGSLSFVAPPNFDLPGDASQDNVYQVQLTASDGQAATTFALAVTVTNSKEGISVRRIASGFAAPVAISAASDTVLLVAESGGAIYRLDTQTGAKSLLVQINSSNVFAVAAAPDFATSGSFFVMYQATFRSILVQRYLRNPAGPTVPDNFGPLLSFIPQDRYGGGWLGFGPDGNLLIATGDDVDSSGAQNAQSFAGKLIRVTPNPDPYAGAAPNFFLLNRIASGLHRPSNGIFVGGNLLLPDQGQEALEEVNLFGGVSGANFGWPAKEGTRLVRGQAPAQAIDPIIEYPKSMSLPVGQGVVGGAISPASVSSLQGQYIFADRGGAIFSIPLSSIQAGRTLSLSEVERRDLDFAPDAGSLGLPVGLIRSQNGTVYILDGRGDVFRVEGG